MTVTAGTGPSSSQSQISSGPTGSNAAWTSSCQTGAKRGTLPTCQRTWSSSMTSSSLPTVESHLLPSWSQLKVLNNLIWWSIFYVGAAMSTYWEPSVLMVRNKDEHFCQNFFDDKKVFWFSIQYQDCLGSPRENLPPCLVIEPSAGYWESVWWNWSSVRFVL